MNPNHHTQAHHATIRSLDFGATYAKRRGFAARIHAPSAGQPGGFEPVPEEVIHNDALREVLEARLLRDAPDAEGLHVRMS